MWGVQDLGVMFWGCIPNCMARIVDLSMAFESTVLPTSLLSLYYACLNNIPNKINR